MKGKRKRRGKGPGKLIGILAVSAAAVLFVIMAGRYVNAWQAAEDERLSAQKAEAALQSVTVRAVVDGDTLLLTDDTKVRLLGIDAPESVHQDKKRNSIYGEMASEHLHELVRGGDRVWILRPGATDAVSDGADLRESDNYGRLLRLVWTDRPDLEGGLTEEVLSESLNARMLRDGYAVLYVMEEDEPYEELFYMIQKEADSAGSGLWSEEGWRAYAALNYFGK